jgi:hypothetical protein
MIVLTTASLVRLVGIAKTTYFEMAIDHNPRSLIFIYENPEIIWLILTK